MKVAIVARVILVSVLACMANQGQTQSTSFSDEKRRAFEAILKDYLLRNPEIVQEALVELERRQQVAQEAARSAVLRDERTKLVNSPHDMVVGNPAGDVSLVEFFDYNCSYCRKAKSDVDALIKGDPRLRIVLKEFPVLGPDSVEASRVAVAAKLQLSPDKMRVFHDRLMATRGRANGEKALALATELGANVAKLQKDMQGDMVNAVLQENTALADRLGISGTPTFILNDDIIMGAVGLEPLRQAIANTRRCGKTKCE